VADAHDAALQEAPGRVNREPARAEERVAAP
jgi:hypothetical protein